MAKKFCIFSLALLLLGGAGCIRLGSSATGPMGIFRTDNKGEAWRATVAYPTAQGVSTIAGLKVYRLVTDPSDPNTMYLATRGQGLFYTYNAGESWQSVADFNGQFIYGLAVDPTDKCTIYATNGQNIYKTTDCSRSWQTVYTEQRPSQRLVALAIDFKHPELIYGAIVGGDVILSSDHGGSWRTIKRFGFDIQHLATDPQTPGRIYVASYRYGLFRSDDGGTSWADLSKGLDAFNDSRNFYRLVLHPTRANTLFWLSKYGILRSDDSGASWQELPLIPPPGSVNVYAFALNPQNEQELYFTATILGDKQQHLRSTFYRSADGGRTWVTKKLPTTTIPVAIYVHPVQPATLFMAFTTLN